MASHHCSTAVTFCECGTKYEVLQYAYWRQSKEQVTCLMSKCNVIYIYRAGFGCCIIKLVVVCIAKL